MSKALNILITGASSGFGAMAARLLARSGHTVYASMLDVEGNNKTVVEEYKKFSDTLSHEGGKGTVKTVEIDVTSEASCQKGVETVLKDGGKIDVLVHNAGHMCLGPTEAFTTGDLAHYFEVNAIGTHRLNRFVLPHMRARKDGLLAWISSSSSKGGMTPWLGPYFAAKAAMDSLAVSYSMELTQWGIGTAIIVPGAFTKGTNHFTTSGHPSNKDIMDEYMKAGGPYEGSIERMLKGMKAIEPDWADPEEVGRALVRVINMEKGSRPFRAYVDPIDDGCEVVGRLQDRLKREFNRNIGIDSCLTVKK
ncbi:short-chain dehydrogenase/reductase SDR [Atractiella rhizophila]|nr:short-chain dehydrogenase/reductase SDR [Atractiella rhizophila]